MSTLDDSPTLCACGCGQPVKKARFLSQQKRFINGHQHKAENNGNYRGGKEAHSCPICGTVFYRWPSSPHTTCGSDKCNRENQRRNTSARGQNKIALSCDHCGERLERYPSQIKEFNFCNRACQGAYKAQLRGDSNPNWHGGPVRIVCEQCGQSFERNPKEAETARWCSRTCTKAATYARVTLTCATCGSNYERGRTTASNSNYCSRACQRRGQAETGIERLAREALTEIGIDFEQEKQIGPYVIDFFLPECNIALEIDGEYWHLIKAPWRDAKRDAYLRRIGIDTVRIRGNELKADEPVRVVGLKIKRVLEKRLEE